MSECDKARRALEVLANRPVGVADSYSSPAASPAGFCIGLIRQGLAM